MLKDNIFSITRFMNLCRKNMVENWKTNLLRVALMYAVMAVIFVWSGYFEYKDLLPGTLDPMVETSISVLLWFGVICGCISASFTMENMKSKTSRLSVLMTPATPFEKYFSRWLISTIVFILVFIIAFKLADYTRVLVYSLSYPGKNIAITKLGYIFASHGDYAFLVNVPIELKRLLIMVYFLFQSCFILGSSIWPKNSLIKTSVAGFLMMLLFGLIMGGIVQLIFGQLYINDKMVPDDFRDNMLNIFFAVGVVYTILNWVLAYYRFKEAEIINRL